MGVAFFIRDGLMIRTARLSGQGEIPAAAGMQSAPAKRCSKTFYGQCDTLFLQFHRLGLLFESACLRTERARLRLSAFLRLYGNMDRNGSVCNQFLGSANPYFETTKIRCTCLLLRSRTYALRKL